VAEISTDMVDWYSGAGHTEEVSNILQPAGNKLITVKAAPAYSVAGRIFFRLRVVE